MPAFRRRRTLARIAAASMVFAGTAASGLDSSQVRSRLLSRIAEDPEAAEVDAVEAEDSELEEGKLKPLTVAEIRHATFELLRGLANDTSSDMRAAAGAGLSRAISLLTPVERIECVCQWALSPHWGERAALARALTSPTPILVTDLVVEQLAQDPHPEVRAGALQAAQARLSHDPETYGVLVARLQQDRAVAQALSHSRWVV